MLSSKPSKSLAKTIIRNMEMNGSLESRHTGVRPLVLTGEPADEEEEEEEEEDNDEDEEEDEEEEDVETYEVKKGKEHSLPPSYYVISNCWPHSWKLTVLRLATLIKSINSLKKWMLPRFLPLLTPNSEKKESYASSARLNEC